MTEIIILLVGVGLLLFGLLRKSGEKRKFIDWVFIVIGIILALPTVWKYGGFG